MVGTIQRQVIKAIIIQAMNQFGAVTTDNADRIERGTEMAAGEIKREENGPHGGGNHNKAR